MNYKKDYEEWLDDQFKGKSGADAKAFVDKEFIARAGAFSEENRISNVAKGMMIGSALSSVPFLAIKDIHPKYVYGYYDDGTFETVKFAGPSRVYRVTKTIGLGADAAVFIAGAVIFAVNKLNANKESVKSQILIDRIIKEEEKSKE